MWRIPKTGIVGRMREWMKVQTSFSLEQVKKAMRANPGKDRDAVRNALRDFVKRGEVLTVERNQRQNYRYNPSWHRASRGDIKPKIIKAMRLISFREPFAVVDIQRVAGAPDRSYIDKLTGKLAAAGHLKRCGFRRCAHGAGREAMYRLADSDRFLVEVMR